MEIVHKMIMIFMYSCVYFRLVRSSLFHFIYLLLFIIIVCRV